jgi:secreted trypsin-like serine protease
MPRDARLRTRSAAAACALAVGALLMTASPALAIGDGIIAATDAGDNVGRMKIEGADGRTWTCTATLIAPDRALTAEHCIWNADEWRDITITFGTRNLDSDAGQTAQAVSGEISDRDYRGLRDSIAIIQLNRSIAGVTPARVAGPGAPSSLYGRGTYVLAAGWGTIDKSQDIVSRELRIASMEVADSTATINSGAIRVGETGGGRPQKGDSGGPLFSYDAEGPIVVGVYTGSGTRRGSQHFYMKTAVDPLFG